MLITADGVDDAASLTDWMTGNGYDARPQAVSGTMGGAETVAIVAASASVARAAMAVLREWIRASRRQVTVEIPNRGSFRVEGPGDIERLIELFDDKDDGDD